MSQKAHHSNPIGLYPLLTHSYTYGKLHKNSILLQCRTIELAEDIQLYSLDVRGLGLRVAHDNCNKFIYSHFYKTTFILILSLFIHYPWPPISVHLLTCAWWLFGFPGKSWKESNSSVNDSISKWKLMFPDILNTHFLIIGAYRGYIVYQVITDIYTV